MARDPDERDQQQAMQADAEPQQSGDHDQDDPAETKNLADSNPDKADELETRLFEHFNAIGHDLKSRPWPIGLNPVYPSQAK